LRATATVIGEADHPVPQGCGPEGPQAARRMPARLALDRGAIRHAPRLEHGPTAGPGQEHVGRLVKRPPRQAVALLADVPDAVGLS
jgi:hypothetical protein